MALRRGSTVGKQTSPEQIVAAALQEGCQSIAYTYTEPTVFFEYTYDTAQLAREAGLTNVYVTNGYMSREMLELFHPYLDAVDLDLKAFRDETYRNYVGGRLKPVLASLRILKQLGIWTEVTTLVIPGINDDVGEMRDIATFLAEKLRPETPWHVSRFYPAYQLTEVPPTPLATLEKARDIGLDAGLHYVYLGNVAGEANTLCHCCGELLIRRSGYQVTESYLLPGGRCPNCGERVAGRGMDKISDRQSVALQR
jgi:pyruvate formate lyase activating enzyme